MYTKEQYDALPDVVKKFDRDLLLALENSKLPAKEEFWLFFWELISIPLMFVISYLITWILVHIGDVIILMLVNLYLFIC